MRNLNFLSNLWGQLGASQSKDVVHDCRSTVVRPSFDRRSTMLKLCTVLVLILTIGVGNVWGDEIYNENFGSNTTSKTKAFSGSTNFSDDQTWSIMTAGTWNQGRNEATPSDYTGASGNAYAQASSTGDLILVFGDISDYTDIVLSFGYRNGASTKVSRTFATYVSANGGTTWTEIECNKSRTTQTWEKITYNVPAASRGNFAVKFSNTAGNQSAVDDVILTGTASGGGSTSVTGVTVSPTSQSIIVGQTFTITPTVAPAGATDKTVSWTSANGSIASVSAGTVTGVAAGGPVNITCTTDDGGFTANCAVTVRSITLQAQDEDGNAIGVGGPGAPTFTAATSTITAAANSGNYVFKQWSVTNATAASTSTTPTTISSPTGNVTVTAVYYKPITITYKANSSTFTTQTYARGGTLAFPASNPDGATYSCTGKTFVGWVGEANKDYSDASTPPTYATAGGSVTTDATYYAVFATAGAGGSGNIQLSYTSLSLTTSYESGSTKTVSGIDFYCNDVMTGTSGSDGYQKIQFKKSSTGPGYIYNSEAMPGNITSIVLSSTTRDMTVNFGTSSNPDGSTETTTCTSSSLTATPSGNYKYFKILDAVDNAAYTGTITINYSSVTYSDYATTCCTELGAVGGAVNYTDPTTAVLTWNDMSNVHATTPYAVTYRTGSDEFDDDNVGSITTNGAGKKTCTITGLSCNTDYDFKIAVTAASGYCDKEEILEDQNSGKYSITKTGGGSVTGGTFTTKISSDAVTAACNGATISIAATPSTGYAFSSWTIDKAGGGTVTPAASTASTSFTMPSDNVTVTAAFSCVEPVVTADPEDADYFIGDSPDALSVTATLASGTRTYLWKVSTNGGSTWSDATGTNNTASYSGASLSTASATTLKFKCVVGNSEGGCTVESDVATITVAEASGWKFKYSGDSWTEHTMTEDAGVASYSISLAADSRFEFGFDGGSFYKNNGTIITTTSGWTFNTSDGNCKIHTGPAGTYTFAINTSTKSVTVTYPTVTHPNDHYVYFKNTNVWGTVYGYLANSGNDNKAAAWPGSVMQPTTTICGETYHYAALNAMSGTYNTIIFNNGSGGYGNQTSDLSTTGSLGKYNANTDAAWHQFKYAISFDKGTGSGDAMASIEDLCPGSNQALTSNSYTKTYYSFAGWIADVDVKVGESTIEAGDIIADGATIKDIQSDINLTAQWSVIPVTALTLNYSSLKKYVGESTVTLSVASVTPASADPSVTWSSSNTSVATVNASTGVVTFVAAGTATITATSTVSGGVTATCSVEVRSMSGPTMQDEDGTAIASGVGKPSATWTVGTRTLTASEETSNYKFKRWIVTNATPASTTDLSTTLGDPTGNVTVVAEFYKPISVAWKVGTGAASGSPTTEVKYGTAISALPSTPADNAIASCGANKFMGWTASGKIEGTGHDAPADLFTTVGGATTLTTNTIYRAVFATHTSSSPVVYTLTKPNTSWSGYTKSTDTDDQGETWSYYAAGANQSGTYYYGLNVNALNYHIASPNFGGNITGIKMWVRNGSSTEGRTVYLCSSNETYNPSSGDLGSASIPKSNDSEVTASISGTFSQFYIYVSAALQFKYIAVTVGGENTTKDYITGCCTPLADFNGTVNWNNPTEAEVSWDNIANVDSWTVKYKTHAAGEYGTWAGAQTVYTKSVANDSRKVTITGLTPCVDYDFQIIATPAEDYCNKDQTINDSQTHAYTVDYSGCSNVTKTAGGATACGSSNLVATFTASLPYELPESVSVTIGGAGQTQGTDFTWSVSAGVGTLTIGSAKQTANIVIDVDGHLLTCDDNPTIGTAALDGSGIFSSSSVAVSVTGCSVVGVVCEWTDYGFVWGTSANPTGNKTQIGTDGTATSWSGALTGSFSTGVTYYYRAYGKNSKDGAAIVYGSDATFIPRSVTFNSNGGSSVDTKYVNSGGTVSAPSAPTKSGYTFGGWYTDNGTWESAVNWSSTISADVTYYAKWNTVSYTISYEGLSGASNTNPTSYNIETPTITLVDPGTRTGYTFSGWTLGGSPITQITVGSTGDKTITANWTINQHTVAVSAVDHVVITATPADESAIAEGANRNVNYNKTVTLNCTPDAHWNLAWDVYKTGETATKVAVSGSGDGATFTMPDYNVTVTAVMTEDTYHTATFKNNGEAIDGYDGVKTYDGTRPSAPTLTDVTDACDKTDCNKFYGWIAEADIWPKTINSVAGKTIYRHAEDIPNVSGADVVYHAVWAKGTAAPEIPNTLIVKWDKPDWGTSGITGTKADGTASTVTLTASANASTSNNYGYGMSDMGSSNLVITISGLSFTGYSSGAISFYSKASQGRTITVEESSGGAYSTVNTTSYDGVHVMSGISNTTTSLRITYPTGATHGSFYFGTIRIFGVNTGTSYTFTKLTSENTAGWATNNWDGYYIIANGTAASSSALNGAGIDGDHATTVTVADETTITITDPSIAFKITYEGTNQYSIQGIGCRDYVNTSGKPVMMSYSEVDYYSIAYNTLTASAGNYLKWNTGSSRFGVYTGETAPTLYKILESFTEFRVTCCDKEITIGTPTKTGSGNVTFESDDEEVAVGGTVETCEGATDITATVTPTNGYQCTALAFSRADGEDIVIDVDPATAVPFTAATDFTLTVERNANTTLNTTVTFTALTDHYIDKMHYNTTQNKSGNYGTAPNLSSETKGEECTGLHYKFIGWIPEGDMNMTTGVPTTTANMVVGGATGKYATGTNYYAIWAEEE